VLQVLLVQQDSLVQQDQQVLPVLQVLARQGQQDLEEELGVLDRRVQLVQQDSLVQQVLLEALEEQGLPD
jgi:hypothetical protein